MGRIVSNFFSALDGVVEAPNEWHFPYFDDRWNNTTDVGADPVDGIRRLKAETDGDIGMSGCATTVRWLIGNGLLDELNLLVHPIAVGRGQRLFEDTPRTPLRLLSSEALPSGVLHLRYAPAQAG